MTTSKRRGAGEGGLGSYDTAAGKRWSIVYRVPDQATRKTRQVRQRGFTTQRAAQTALRAQLTAVAAGSHIARTELTLAAYLEDRWLPEMRTQVRATTAQSYARNLRLHVVPSLGGRRLRDLDATALTTLYGELSASGRRDHAQGQGLSSRSVRYVHTILRSALARAVELDLLARNPADRAKAPKAQASGDRHEQIHTWTHEELGAFLAATTADRLGSLWHLLATTGLRRGEAIGLCWDSVDLDAARLSVRRSLVDVTPNYAGAQPVWSDPKTARGRRSLSLDPGTVELLRGVRRRQAGERLLVGAGYADHGLVFAHPDGRPLHPEHLSRTFNDTIRRLHGRSIRLHDLRHTWATLALEAGVHPKVVQERLGHAGVNITLDIYSHVSLAMESDAADRVAALFTGSLA